MRWAAARLSAARWPCRAGRAVGGRWGQLAAEGHRLQFLGPGVVEKRLKFLRLFCAWEAPPSPECRCGAGV